MNFWVRQLLARAGQFLFILGAASVLTFALMEIAPGDPSTGLRLNPGVSEDAEQAFRERTGLNRPWWSRYLNWIAGVPRGDWGESVHTGMPVWPLLRDRAWRTLALAFGAQLAAWILALHAAALGAAFSSAGAWIDAGFTTLLALPDAVVALAVWIAAVHAWPSAPPIAIAVLALTLSAAPALWRQAHAAFAATLSAPFVEAARDHGIPGFILWTRYIVPAAAAPLTALAGATLGGALSASLLVETLTGYPGLGPLLVEAVFARDPYLVAGAMVLSAGFWTLGGMLADLAQVWIDPRLRERSA